MNHSFIVDNSNPRIVVLFAGWAMDRTPFASLTVPEGYDLVVVWDYRSLQLNVDFRKYKEICVIAWSYGVAMGAVWMKNNSDLPITRRIAVAGTLHPVDDEQGIPVAIFEATLQALSPASLMKFYRRMAGGSEAFSRFKEVIPDRDVAELADELSAIRMFSEENPDLSVNDWDTVYIPLSDNVIPTANQQKVWGGHPDVREVNASHLFDFQSVVCSLSCKPQIAERFASSVPTYDDNAGVQAYIADRLVEKWKDTLISGEMNRIVEIGAGSGVFTRRYLSVFNPKDLLLLDIASISPDLPGVHRICDAEIELASLPDASADAIVSASTVQWFNSLAKFLKECVRVLRPGGVVVMSTFGPATYSELSGLLMPQVRYFSPELLEAIIPDGLIIRCLSDERVEAKFSSPKMMLDHMRLTGVTASSQTASERLGAALAILRSGVTTLTYQPVYAILERAK